MSGGIRLDIKSQEPCGMRDTKSSGLLHHHCPTVKPSSYLIDVSLVPWRLQRQVNKSCCQRVPAVYNSRWTTMVICNHLFRR